MLKKGSKDKSRDKKHDTLPLKQIEPGPEIQKLQDSDYSTVKILPLHTVIERTEMSHTQT